MSSADLDALEASLDLNNPHLAQYRISDDIAAMRLLLAEARRLQAEVAEHRAARGIEAPPGWQRSNEALWERAASNRRAQDEDGEVLDECPDGYLHVYADGLWERWRDGKQLACGREWAVLPAIAAAEAALKEGA